VTKLRLTFARASLALSNSAIRALRKMLFRTATHPKKILLFRTGSIGDNICAMPAIVSVKRHFPGAELHILTNAGGKNLVSLQNLISPEYFDSIIDYSTTSRTDLFRILSKGRYDLVIELPQDQVSLKTELRNMMFFRFAGIPAGFGWQVNTSFAFRRVQEKAGTFISERQRLLEILKREGIDIFPDEYPLPVVYPESKLDLFFKKLPLQECVAIVPGAKRSQNRYPMDRFIELGRWLRAKGYQVIVVGGPDDIKLGAQLESSVEGSKSFCGQFDALESAAILSRCKLTITNDTGPMHLSYAVGTPVIGLFSSRDFQEKWFPPKPSIALRNYNVHCSLCFSETCANNICMQGIPLEAVKNAFLELEAQL
jgi:ADP-heptose:LPS heptosyltransferase